MSSITVIVQYLLTKFRLSIFLTGPGSTSKLVPGFASRDPKDLPAVESLGGGGAYNSSKRKDAVLYGFIVYNKAIHPIRVPPLSFCFGVVTDGR